MSKELETIAREWYMRRLNLHDVKPSLREAAETLPAAIEGTAMLAAFAAHALSQQPPAGQVTVDIPEAIKAFEFIKEIGSREPMTANDRTIATHQMVKWANHGIEALASAPRPNEDAGGWISVKDRLPEYPDVSRSMYDNKEYLVVVKSGTDRDKPLRMVAWYYGKDHGWSIANVTHWSELPPSPPTE